MGAWVRLLRTWYKLYNGADGESANFAEDRMLSDYVFAASRRGADAFAAQGAPLRPPIYRFTRFAPGSKPTQVGAFPPT